MKGGDDYRTTYILRGDRCCHLGNRFFGCIDKHINRELHLSLTLNSRRRKSFRFSSRCIRGVEANLALGTSSGYSGPTGAHSRFGKERGFPLRNPWVGHVLARWFGLFYKSEAEPVYPPIVTVKSHMKTDQLVWRKKIFYSDPFYKHK